MKNTLIKRTITAIIFATVLLSCLIFGKITFLLLFGTIITLGLFEYYKIVISQGYKPHRFMGFTFGILLLIVNFLIASGLAQPSLLMALPLPVIILAISELYKKSEYPFINIGHTLLGVLYIALPLSLSNYIVYSELHNQEYNYQVLMAVLFLIWTNDSGAYLVGSMIGKHKLFPRISPKKTWEGSIGGGVSAVLLSLLISQYVPEIGLLHWVAIAIITVVFGTFGDLTESMLKRNANIKDSGNILPGHGGILDRFDSLLMAAPMVLFYIVFFV